jgi:predicted ester cyclase
MEWRAVLHGKLLALAAAADGDVAAALAEIVAADGVWRVARPVEALEGAEAVLAGWLRPLRAALPGAMRRDDLVLGGVSRTGSGRWLATLGHYVGNFTGPLFGIPPSGKLVFLRCGEFYRIEDGRVVEARILPDLLDLMRQAGHGVLPVTAEAQRLGTEILFPAPATHDGVLPDHPGRSEASAALVEAMLADLRVFDPANFASEGQTGPGGYWHRDMLWYGPHGIGSNVTYDGFQRDHRVPFLTAFPDRVGGNHFARFGDGDYVCSGGWPSMTMTHGGPYLGVPATGRAMTLRVMDFWRVQDGSIRENWVLLDMVDLFAQMGVDLLPAG